MTHKTILFASMLLLAACQSGSNNSNNAQTHSSPVLVGHQHDHSLNESDKHTDLHLLFPDIPEEKYDSIFQSNPAYINDGFDFPVGKPNAQGYFKALDFGQNLHLGEDWNGHGGGNSDLGDPVYSSGNGLVIFSEHVCCGWGNVIRVVHRLANHPQHPYVETVYAHLNSLNIKVGDLVRRGEVIGSIGTADGRYSAHLHLEMRSFINMSLGPGYSEDQFGYLDPSQFIQQHRPY